MKNKFLSIVLSLIFAVMCLQCAPKEKTPAADDAKIKSGISDKIDPQEQKIKEEDKTNVKTSLPLPE